MKARFWSIISLAAFVAAMLLWLEGNRRRDRAAVPPTPVTAPAPTGAVSRAAAPAAPVHLLTRLDHLHTAAGPSAGITDPQFPWRLRNTPEPLDQLSRRGTAILLRNALVDTAARETVAVPDALRADAEPGAYVVQSRTGITPAFRRVVQAAGGRIVSYIPNNALLVRLSSEGAGWLARDGASVLPYEPYYKLPGGWLDRALAGEGAPPGNWLALTAFAEDREAVRESIRGLGASVLAEQDVPFGEGRETRLVIAPGAVPLASFAALSGVHLVERCAPRVLMNDLIRERLTVAVDTVDTNNYLGLTGSNVWVSLNDTGVDAEHPDLKDRVFGSGNAALTDLNGHGTHMAGIIASSGENGPTGTNIPPGSITNANFRGIAPEAKLFVHDLDLVTGPASDAALQALVAATNYLTLERTNALVSNNSWGYDLVFEYDSSAASYDAAVRDALPEEPGMQPLLFVFPAGNRGAGNNIGSGGVPGLVVSPATAKNVLTVGAIEQIRPITTEVVQTNQVTNIVDGEFEITNVVSTNLVPVEFADSNDEVAPFSSRGNVGIGVEGDRGRFKPDVVAPGVFLVSTRAKDWTVDQLATNVVVYNYPDQRALPGEWSRYSLLIPPRTQRLTITTLPAPDSPVPFPDLEIYVREGGDPTVGDFVGVTNAVVDAPAEGAWYYSIANPTPDAVSFNLRVRLEVLAASEEYLDLLTEINEPLEPHYRYDSGTSGSAAAVSGLLALMTEFFEEELEQPYSPALMKALLINGARSLSSQYNLEVRPQVNHQGWGLPVLTNVLPAVLTNALDDPAGWPLQWVDQSPTNTLATGESHQYDLELSTNSVNSDLRVTLVWTDPPGNPVASIKLVNDLDLVVSNRATGQIFLGNDIRASSDYNQPASTNASERLPDNINNVENVFLRGPIDTNYTVFVNARRVNVNAVTGHTNGIVQDYALVVSVGDTNALTFTPVVSAVTNRMEVTIMTNGLPLLYQRTGAHSPLIGTRDGTTNQWHFYVFTNEYNPALAGGETNFGPYVAFLTFTPPNLSQQRTGGEADIDLYVARGATASGLTNLDPAVLAGTIRSRDRTGTELTAFDDAAIGEVFYVGVKAEDQMSSEYGIIGLSSDEPFGNLLPDGSFQMRALPVPRVIPDGTPEAPGAALMFGVGIYPMTVGRTIVYSTFLHEEAGDLVGNLNHSARFAVLNNHSPIPASSNGVFSAVYDDAGNGIEPFAQHTDGPGGLVDFIGSRGEGVWQFTMVDNALGHTGLVQDLSIRIFPAPDLLTGTFVTVQPNELRYVGFVDVPPDATLLRILLSQMDLPLDVLIRFDLVPSLTEFDKIGRIPPPSGELTVGPTDVPPLRPGRYHVSIFNPNAVPASAFVRAVIERDPAARLARDYTGTNAVPLVDDARMVLTNYVGDARAVAELKVGLRASHPRLSDLAFSLVSPSGTRTVLVENRGDTNRTQYGYDEVRTNFHHVALTYSTNTGLATLYLDGAAQVQRAVGKFQPDTREALFLGRQPSTNAPPAQYLGLLDEVDLYGRELGPAEILGITLFGGAAKPVNALVSRWSFDGNGDDAMTNNPASVEGPAYVPGRFGAGLQFADEGDRVVISNLAALDVGLRDGFTLDAWVNPADLTTNRTLAVWGDGTNRIGVEFGFRPGPDTNTASGLLYANLRDRSGAGHLIEMPTQGLFRTNALVTNAVYVTLTDDTNLTVLPIKFAEPDVASTGRSTNRFISGFEARVFSRVTSLTNTQVFDGWEVVAGGPAVLHAPPLAHTGTNLLVLRDGSLFTNITTIPGRTYRLSVVHRQQPYPDDMVSWWDGQNTTADLLGSNDGAPENGLAYRAARVGRGFSLTNTALMRVPADATLDFTEELTAEFWYAADDYPLPGLPLLAKAGASGINYLVELSDAGLAVGFNDPTLAAPGSDLPAGLEGLRFSPPPLPGSFHHVAATWRQMPSNQVELALFLDGRQERIKVLAGQLSNAVNSADLVLGSNAFTGVVDELTLYRRALDPEEIRDIYWLDSLGKARPPALSQTLLRIDAGANITFASDPAWRTNGITFLATATNTLVELAGLAPGAMLDSVGIIELPATTFLPEEPLKPFAGESALGDWRLEVTDRRVGATNDLESAFIQWQLQLTFAPATVPAVLLTNGVPYTNAVPPGAARYFMVDVPLAASQATNSLAANAGLDLWFNHLGLPTYGASGDDHRVLTNVIDAHAVVLTNGSQVLDDFRVVQATTTVPVLVPGQRYYLAVTNTGAATPFRIQVDFDALDGDVPGITVLDRGQTIATNIAPTTTLQYFKYVVNTNTVAASFEVRPSNGNVELFLRKATPVPAPLPTPQQFDYAGRTPGTAPEIVLVTQDSLPVPISAGIWYIGVQNVDTQRVNYTVRVLEYSNVVDRVVDLVPGVGVAETAQPGLLSRLFFRFTAVGSPPAVQFDLTGLAGDVELLARLGSKPTASAFDFVDLAAPGLPAKLVLRQGAALPSLNGEWYLAVNNQELTPAGFTITASYPPAVAPVPPLSDNVPVRSTIAADQPGQTPVLEIFSFDVLPGATNVVFQLQPLEDAADLLVRFEQPPDLGAFDYFSVVPGALPDSVVVDAESAPVPLAPGRWFVGVINSSLYATTYEIRARAFPSSDTDDIRLDPAVSVNNGVVTFTWTAAPGLRFQVEYATTIDADGTIPWIPIPGEVTSADGTYVFVDDGSQTGGGADFKIYRVRWVP